MKIKRTQRAAPRVQQRQVFYYAVVGAALITVGGVLLFFYLNVGTADDTYAVGGSDFSVASGFWNDDVLWDCGTSPGTNNISKNIEIFKNVTSFDGPNDASLSFGNQATLTVTDTLVIHGNLSLGNKSQLFVGENGVLVVTGNLDATNKLAVASGGVIAVGGSTSGNKLM